jgi:hypothetical protein
MVMGDLLKKQGVKYIIFRDMIYWYSKPTQGYLGFLEFASSHKEFEIRNVTLLKSSI